MTTSQLIFTPDEIASMNAYQESGVFHPFTCGFCGNDLIAREDGWYCPTSGCLYRQEWAHAWMKDWSWKKAAQGVSFIHQVIEVQSKKEGKSS